MCREQTSFWHSEGKWNWVSVCKHIRSDTVTFSSTHRCMCICLSSRLWRGCGDQCLGSQKKVIHRDPLLVSQVTLATCCLTVDCLKHPTFLKLCFFQDGSRGSGSGKEGWLQPPVRHLGSRHYRHWAGWASAAHVWPPSDEVHQHGRTCMWPWMATTEWSGW